jgi:hypothetical protein
MAIKTLAVSAELAGVPEEVDEPMLLLLAAEI